MATATQILNMPIRALVVDDDDVDRERLTRMLRQYSHPIEVREVGSKSGAIRELRGHKRDFAFIFLDFKLTDEDGRELLPEIWESIGSDGVIIAVTGAGSERAAAEAIKLGIHDYLSKQDLSVHRVLQAIDKGLQWLQSNQRARQSEQEMIHRSLHDPLTNLFNRYVFFDRLDHQCAVHRREDGSFAVLMMDLDRFKEINDQFGHETGDMVLQETARRMIRSVREIDTIARLGGDEFAVIMPGICTLEQALIIGNKLVESLQTPIVLPNFAVFVSGSIGIAVCPQHGNDPHTLVNRADHAMYRAKHDLQKVILYDNVEPGSTTILDKTVLIGEIKVALERSEIEWYWQPKINLKTRELSGFEALARWRHEQHGIIAPDVFIHAIEESPVIWQFTLATIDCVLAQVVTLQGDYPSTSVAINISARVLQYERFVEVLLERLQSVHMSPAQVVLELTETSLISNPIKARDVLDQLAASGFSLAIDDFGADFTSFNYLRDFSIREIKLDRSYITRLCERKFDRSFVTSMAVFCRSLGLHLIAEGVENPTVEQTLTEPGCDFAQGYSIAAPMPFEQVSGWMHNFH